MALNKTPVIVNFSKGLDLKSDPNQVPIGNFLALQNSVFDTAGRLTKRNGFDNKIVSALPNANQTTITTFKDNLLATGSNLFAYSQDTSQWFDKGSIQPIGLSVQSLVRNSSSQSGSDIAVTDKGLTCLVYMDGGAAYYQVSDSVTGQQIVNRVALPATSVNPRVFLLNKYFIVTFLATVGGIAHLQYIAIPVARPASPRGALDISAVVRDLAAGYDGYVANNTLYLSWASSSTTVSIGYLSQGLIVSASVNIVGSHTADLVSVTADISNSTPVIWVSFWDSGSQDGYAAAFNQALTPALPATQIITNTGIAEITSVATGMLLSVFYQNINSYTFGGRTDYITKLTVTQAGVVSSSSIILRSVGLGSKAFIAANSMIYMLAAYADSNQPTYFLIDSNGNIYSRLAYSNGGGYASSQVLPSVININDVYYTSYLIKDFLATVNKGTNNPSGTPSNAIYTQTGVNLALFTINTTGQFSAEIANTLHLTGGQLWMYDGVKPVEHGFQVWPTDVNVTTAGAGGVITAGTYFYQFTYEWTDNQGNLHRSAPSIPVSVVTTGSTSENTLKVPTLRLTYKITPNPVRIVGYRWSIAQQAYYQFTSITSPVLNDPTVDSVTITDAKSDAQILGQTLLYTTGGVIENIAAPANYCSTLFKNRLFVADAEDRNLIWYSKQVIETVPVEMSDLFTIYVAPTSGAQGSTGDITALSAMDDKLIIFKANAIYYLTGIGPDNTGANNDFTDPVYITSSVGCDNPSSIVLMPTGIMFQSGKGIWKLGRDLSTQYIGDAVESYNSHQVKSAQSIPATNQLRFVLNNSTTLMYDYYFNQWGTFSNINAISSTLYKGLQTYLNEFGEIYQESPGKYLDGSVPVLMSFTTSWMNVAGLKGYERFYFMYLLGTYLTPFKLSVQLAYDYNSNITQQIMVSPDNYTQNWGGDPVWGARTPWGGPGNVFQARLFPQHQKCQSFQITINEIYDPSFNVTAGAGLTMSGLNIVIGTKKGYSPQKAARSFG